jgi:ribokinase
MNKVSIVVVGSLNTDIFLPGVSNFPKSGQQVYAETLSISPGGKSRNMAQMIAVLSKEGTVAMIGKTVEDPYGLWKLPMDALKEAGVNTDFIKLENFSKVKKFPGIAIIPVDKNGNNTIYVAPGINNDFSVRDIDYAKKIISGAKFMVVTFEKPIKTSLHAIDIGNRFGLKVLLDPGGISEAKNPRDIFKHRIFLLKPNEHEAEMLTGIKVTNFIAAKKAAKKLLSKKIENVLITHGKNGAYFFNGDQGIHIKIPKVKIKNTRDETGCGDQTMAAIVASLNKGLDIVSAVEVGILAGTLQYYKPGITPVTKSELIEELFNVN